MARLENNVHATVSTMLAGVRGVVREAAEEIITEAKAITPVDTAQLRDSGEIVESEGGITHLRFHRMNGDFDVALFNHEDMTINHPNGGEDHYLSKPALRIAPTIPERIARRLNGNG